MFGLWRNSGDTISLRSLQPPAPIHPPLIWWWFGRAWACEWMLIATGCETDSQSRLECLSPVWSSLQEGTKGALQGSAGWISCKEPMAEAAGWLARRGLLRSQWWVTAQSEGAQAHTPLKFITKVKANLPWTRWRDEVQSTKGSWRWTEMWTKPKWSLPSRYYLEDVATVTSNN